MNDPEMKTTTAPELADLREQCGALRRQLTMLLMAPVVLSFTFLGFLYVQNRRAARELESIRPEATKVTDASAKEDPVIKTFMTKLTDYGKTHPDFAPLIARYRMQDTSSVPATAVSPASAASPVSRPLLSPPEPASFRRRNRNWIAERRSFRSPDIPGAPPCGDSG